jgi:hypothetical protein
MTMRYQNTIDNQITSIGLALSPTVVSGNIKDFDNTGARSRYPFL